MIAGERLVWVALCRCDCWGEPGLGGAVPWGLAGRAWSGWRCAVVIGGESVVWVALCRCDWRGERGLGGVVWVALCHCDWRGGRGMGSAVPL